MAYPTATQVRDRISVGGVALDTGRFPDTWVDEQVLLFASMLEHHTGDSYISRSAVDTMSVPSYTTKLILPNVHVTAVTSITVDGTAVTIDTQQPDLALGIVHYSGGFRPGTKIVATYTHGQTTTPLAVTVACAKYVERMATMERSGSTPDVSRVGFEGGGSTVYVQPDPANGKLTGFREVDTLINTLDRYVIPGIA